MASSDSYQELSREEAVQIKDGAIQHASHVMLYSKVDEKLFDSHDIKYAVLVSYIYITSYVCSVWSHSQTTFSFLLGDGGKIHLQTNRKRWSGNKTMFCVNIHM